MSVAQPAWRSALTDPVDRQVTADEIANATARVNAMRDDFMRQLDENPRLKERYEQQKRRIDAHVHRKLTQPFVDAVTSRRRHDAR